MGRGKCNRDTMDDARFDELTALATDSRYGKAREMIVLGIGKSKKKGKR